MVARMNTHEFQSKRRGATVNERFAAQEHFLGLCRMLGQPPPAEADLYGAWFTFVKGAQKIGVGQDLASAIFDSPTNRILTALSMRKGSQVLRLMGRSERWRRQSCDFPSICRISCWLNKGTQLQTIDDRHHDELVSISRERLARLEAVVRVARHTAQFGSPGSLSFALQFLDEYDASKSAGEQET